MVPPAIVSLKPSPFWATSNRSTAERVSSQPENPYSLLIADQSIAVIPEFTLESGTTIRNVPVAYTTRGNLSPNGDNAMVICHALTGSADVEDWWGPLIGGPGRAFDIARFYVVCMNSLGSPYGSVSPVTNKDGDQSQGRYGPEFPLTTIRDDVNLHRLLLNDLGVKQVAAVIGGSMGGMLVLEWAYFGKNYVRSIVPIATSSRHSAWGISWGEAQRQSIYSDPKYEDGYYSLEDPPATGLGAARMSALLTYRSRNSFESRFGRNTPDLSRRQVITDGNRPSVPSSEHWIMHNDGHKHAKGSRTTSTGEITPTTPTTPHPQQSKVVPENSQTLMTDPQFSGTRLTTAPTPPTSSHGRKSAATYFSAQSYLRYQGAKFVKRFDSNCYIALTRKMDTHDVSAHCLNPKSSTPVRDALAQLEQPALVIGIESDGLFTFAEQEELAASIPNARLRNIDSPEGHDAFLLQFEQVNAHILDFLYDTLPDIMNAPEVNNRIIEDRGSGEVTKTSTFGEAEPEDIAAWEDITAW
ncbi:MAG: homoserine O- acetyltransferase [Vezdaea acicularis]|nr:MAG: homoserine O- acetyltransferase [Vezdaea acicularis]